jgi:hypothetical protein
MLKETVLKEVLYYIINVFRSILHGVTHPLPHTKSLRLCIVVTLVFETTPLIGT